ncbi:hypothetical protein [Streptomyces chattanoogensis]|uniref:hypothetical protein n=1 Tax=Streptomyces chattanoogensis TaxID=66876 RepID=UPI003684A739
MSTVTEKHNVPSVDDLPIDVELVEDSTNSTLLMQLATSTREAIESKTPILVSHLQLLLVEELGADEDPEVREMFSKAYKLLDLRSRPTNETTTFGVFFFNRDLALLARQLLWVYSQRRESGES